MKIRADPKCIIVPSNKEFNMADRYVQCQYCGKTMKESEKYGHQMVCPARRPKPGEVY